MTGAAHDDSADLAAMLDEPRPAIDPRTVPVRFSNLKHMGRSALHYFDAVQADREDTISLRFGRGAHALAFGQPVVKYDAGQRRGKAWDAFAAQHADKEILNAKEWAAAESIATALRDHPLAGPLLFDHGTVHERRIEWEWLGRKCASTLDVHSPAILVDLKTTRDAEPGKFERDAFWRGYHAQLAFYSLAYEHAYGHKPAASYIVAIESKRPHAVTVLAVPDELLQSGEMMCRGWFERLLVCEQSNAWPAYSQSVVTMQAPNGGDVPITIGGEAFEWDEVA